MNVNQQQFVTLLGQHGIELNETQLRQFDIYYRELVDWNERMNLTGITEESQVYVKHFYDSVSLAFFVDLQSTSTLADIGSGAGFPSIPLKIAFPHLQVTIVDSLNKRIQFLQHLISKLDLVNARAVHGRAEDMGRLAEHRDKYDLVTARAVARLNVLNEFCMPFAKVGGTFAAMKGSNPAEELEEASNSVKLLQGKVREVHAMKLPMEEADRHIIVIDKLKPTPAKYPRKAGTPIKEPLK